MAPKGPKLKFIVGKGKSQVDSLTQVTRDQIEIEGEEEENEGEQQEEEEEDEPKNEQE